MRSLHIHRVLFIFILITYFFQYYSCIKIEEEKNPNATLETLKAVPYLNYSREKANKEMKGVVSYYPKKSYAGYNLFNGTLIDMEGNVINKWPKKKFCKILPNGEILAQDEGFDKFCKYTWNFNLIWEKRIHHHHDIALTHKNTILIPSSEMYVYKGRKVIFDLIVELSQDGQQLSIWSTWKNLKKIRKFHKPSPLDLPSTTKLEERKRNPQRRSILGADYDYYHLNSIQVLPEIKKWKKNKTFQKGNWLICLKHVNLVLILDKESKEIVWDYGIEELDLPHMPRMLDNGNIIIYDNGFNRKFSRIIEVDPLKKRIIWEYKAEPPESFFSDSLGSAQRLPNGNTLIADSVQGRAFEVTNEGKIVWEWYNPDMNKEGKRKSIYRIIRYPSIMIENILKRND